MNSNEFKQLVSLVLMTYGRSADASVRRTGPSAYLVYTDRVVNISGIDNFKQLLVSKFVPKPNGLPGMTTSRIFKSTGRKQIRLYVYDKEVVDHLQKLTVLDQMAKS